MGWLGNLLGPRQRHSDRWHKTGQVVRNRQLSGRRTVSQFVADTGRAGVRVAKQRYGVARDNALLRERDRYGHQLSRSERAKVVFHRAKNAWEDYQQPRDSHGRIKSKSRTRRVTYARRRVYKPYAPRRRYARRSWSLGPW
jgi:hypothetical protein